MSRKDTALTDHAAAVGDVLLDLYGHVGVVPAAEFKSWALDRLRRVLRFDSAFWAEGAEFGATIFDVHIHDSVHPAAEWLADYGRFKQDDPLALAVFAHKGRTIHDVDVMPREAWLAHPEYGPFCRKHRIAYTLCTMDYDPVTTLVEVISVYRASAKTPYTAAEQQCMQFLFPHLLETRRRNLQAECASVGCRDVSAETAAICNRHGVLHHAGEHFIQLLRREFPRWRGPHLPPALQDIMEPRRSVFSGRHAVFTARPRSAFHLLHARQHTPQDTLTAGERRVAEVLAEGLSYRAGAERLGIAVSTFNKHASTVYRKLGIEGRAALVQRLAQAGQRP